ncbi:MAG: GGDEF and EAL domain-containing protein [Lachnospiraceae bacterium]|nr:GGDEF and EAL domain-containing protein [Lachnospiraceae bacterium]
MKQEVDKSGLESTIFSAFADTSKRQYLYLCNMNTNVSRWSNSAVDCFELPGEYMINAAEIWENLIHPEDRKIYHEDILKVFSGEKDVHELEYRVRNKDGDYVVCSCYGKVVKGIDGKPDMFAGTITNHGIVDNIDPVTNLYNSSEFLRALSLVHEKKIPIVILMVGVNQFHNINSIYGYDNGDRVLKEFALGLKKIAGKQGAVYRMEGTKFALCIRDMDVLKTEKMYEQIQNMGRNEIVINDIYIPLSISGGAAFAKDCDMSKYSVREGLMQVLKESKREKHGELVFFSEEHQDTNQNTIELLAELRKSIMKDCQGFYLCYQPIVKGKKEKSGEIMGMEALVRWHSDVFGEVPPGLFIPLLENDTCFYRFGNWILRQALMDGKKIVEQHPYFIVNVNVAYTQLERTGFRTSVMDALRETGFPPQNLQLELTERCRNLDREYLRKEIEFFHENGLKVAIDDFGTGASSLSLLRDLNVDCLKIDQTFVMHIEENRKDQIIVDAIAQCARQLGISLCMEGVENQKVCNFLQRYDVDCHQGYYYSRPVRAEAFMKLVG